MFISGFSTSALRRNVHKATNDIPAKLASNRNSRLEFLESLHLYET